MTMEKISAICVSDISLGFGSPQIMYFVKSIKKHLNLDNIKIYEPDQNERPIEHRNTNSINIERIYTEFPIYLLEGLLAYLPSVLDRLNFHKPQVIILSSPKLMMVIPFLKYKPKYIVCLMLESLEFLLENLSAWKKIILISALKIIKNKVDLFIFPEENRAILDTNIINIDPSKIKIVYNAANKKNLTLDDCLKNRKKIILYSGSISEDSFLNYMLEYNSSNVIIELFGIFEGKNKNKNKKNFYNYNHNLIYSGYLSAMQLNERRKQYAYSICMWRPTDNHLLYAAPNKFFESIADGVVPIVAPHPQCKLIILKYKCGILLKDWSYQSFKEALDYANAIYGTDTYYELVKNCLQASNEEVNWEHQFYHIKENLSECNFLN